MDSGALSDLGLLALRAGMAYVYLYGAWMIAGTAERRRLTAGRSMVLVAGTRLAGDRTAGRLLGLAATAFMVAGGVGLLLGIGTRVAALLLIAFTLPGIVVHMRELTESGELVDRVAAQSGGEPKEVLARLKWSGYAGHRSSANKNWALIGAAAFVALAEDPAGRWSLDALIGS